jgi:hypothetical protein
LSILQKANVKYVSKNIIFTCDKRLEKLLENLLQLFNASGNFFIIHSSSLQHNKHNNNNNNKTTTTTTTIVIDTQQQLSISHYFGGFGRLLVEPDAIVPRLFQIFAHLTNHCDNERYSTNYKQ